MIEIKIPELAESITEGTISRWMVKEGDEVREGQVLFELETDKVNIEINAEDSGILSEIRSEEGDTVEVGDVVALLNEVVSNGSAARSEDTTLSDAAELAKIPRVNREPEEPTESSHLRSDLRTATPSARKLARERGLDLQAVEQGDAFGRIDVRMIDRMTNRDHELPQLASQDGRLPVEGSDPVRSLDAHHADHKVRETMLVKELHPDRPEERMRMSRRRQTIAARLVEVQQTAAMLTTFNEVDMSAIMDLRRRKKDEFMKKHGVRLGYMSFFTSAVVGALKAYPMLNAEIQDHDIVLKKYYDIGIAVSTDEGLVVPVLRQADKLNFVEIEREIASLSDKARRNELRLSDLQGGTFTITNGGVFGSLLSTPILNAPQVGILGMHKIQTRPVTIDGDRMENRPMMYVALSYDHRIVDGKEAVSFLVKVKELLEDPEQLLLEG